MEGDTDANGAALFDIKDICVFKKGETAETAKRFNVIARIEITCPGYRDFKDALPQAGGPYRQAAAQANPRPQGRRAQL